MVFIKGKRLGGNERSGAAGVQLFRRQRLLVKGNQHTETIRGTDDEGNPTTDWVTVIDNYPTEGTPGVDGVLGCVVVYWDKEA